MKIKSYSAYQLELLSIRVPHLAKQLQDGIIGEIEAFEKAEDLTGKTGVFAPSILDLGTRKENVSGKEWGKEYARAYFSRLAKG